MDIKNDYIFFPVTKTGYWHNGIHKYKKDRENTVFSTFAGKILMKKQDIISTIYPSRPPKIIYKREVILTNPTFIEKYENLSSIDISKLKKTEKENLLEAIGLSSISTYILQKHTILFTNNTFSYYSFIRHLSKLYEFKKIANDEYIFPHDKLGDYGKSEGETNMFQQEYFICSDSDFFTISAVDIFDYCDTINDEIDLYKREEQPFEELYFAEKTEFSVLNKERDYRAYPHSLHLKIKKYHVKINEIHKTENFLRVESNNDVVSVYDKDNNIINEVKIDIINPNTNNTEIKFVDTQLLKAKKNDWMNNLFYIGDDPYNVQSFWTETDSLTLQHWDNYIFTKVNTTLKKYTMPPDIKIFSKLESPEKDYPFRFLRVQETGITILKSVDNKEFVHIHNNDRDFYFSKDDIEYKSNYWKDFKASTTFFFKEDLTSYNPDDNDYKNCSDLQEIMKNKNIIDTTRHDMDLEKFLQTNKDKTIKCAFQHISEWSQIKINPFKIDHPEETSDLWEKLYIWGKNGKSSSLPKEISDSSKFVYFHPQYFENWLFSLHRCFAEKLIVIQDLIMQDWRMMQGNCGIYYNFHDADTTFCNQAVYETIKQVDKNYLSFLLNVNEPAWDLEKYNNEKLLSLLKTNQSVKNGAYIYKKSNLWHDILELQAQRSNETGICKIESEQAFYMAQLGYVVIVAWKNLKPYEKKDDENYSPHFVTVRPTIIGEAYPGLNNMLVAHVGYGNNCVKSLKNTFPDKGNNQDLKQYQEVFFFCNTFQSFI